MFWLANYLATRDWDSGLERRDMRARRRLNISSVIAKNAAARFRPRRLRRIPNFGLIRDCTRRG